MVDIYNIASEKEKKIYKECVEKYVKSLENYKNKGTYQVEKLFS